MTTLASRLTGGGVVLCYHNVVPEAQANLSRSLGQHMPLPTFERQMRWLAANYDVISLEDLVDRLSHGRSLRGAAAVTFDDGYGGVFEHGWPLLRELGIPATAFVVADAPERSQGFWWDHPDVPGAFSPARRRHWLTALRGDSAAIVASLAPTHNPAPQTPSSKLAGWQTITEAVKSGLRLGAHSVTHRSLPALDERDLQREVVESRDVITRRTGVTPTFFAYPYGLWNDTVRRAVRAAGYRAAFTLDYGHNAGPADPWVLRRVNVPAGIEDSAFEAWTAGLNLRPWNDS